MNRNVRLGIALLAGGMLASGSASAALWGWQGTLADWAALGSINDGPPPPGLGVTVGTGDGDTTFTYVGSSLTFAAGDVPYSAISVRISEQPINGSDLYKVVVGYPVGGLTGGYLDYRISSTNALNAAALDTEVTTTASLSKFLCSSTVQNGECNAGTAFLALTSVDSNRDPVAPTFTPFAPANSFYVRDLVNSGNLVSTSNEFTRLSDPSPAPEIDAAAGVGAVTLLAGMLGLLAEGRRRRGTVDQG